MKTLRLWCAGLLVVMGAGVVGGGYFRVQDSREIHREMELDRGRQAVLSVDNIFGDVIVRGTSGHRVEISATETLRARSREKLERARQEVEFRIEQDGNDVSIYVDGPFRHERGTRWDGNIGYVAHYDIEVLVPHRIDLSLKTVNDGDVVVEDIEGDFFVRNVNGDIRMEGIDGSGEATTVNGPVHVRFDGNPTKSSAFKSVNGALDIGFRSGLAAEVSFKTMNGDLWTDFEVEPVGSSGVDEDWDGSTRVLRTNRWSTIRIDRGGPELSFQTLNGDIFIRNTDS